jgi:hypothetical protein
MQFQLSRRDISWVDKFQTKEFTFRRNVSCALQVNVMTHMGFL